MTAFRQQDQDIIKAIYEDRRTLDEYAADAGCSRDEAETRLADALRRSKTRARWGGISYRTPSETSHIPHQGHTFPGLAVDETPIVIRQEEEFDDLDAWLYGDEE